MIFFLSMQKNLKNSTLNSKWSSTLSRGNIPSENHMRIKHSRHSAYADDILINITERNSIPNRRK